MMSESEEKIRDWNQLVQVLEMLGLDQGTCASDGGVHVTLS